MTSVVWSPTRACSGRQGYCAQIDLYFEFVESFGGGGSSGCDADDVGFCDSCMNPSEAHVFV